MAVVGAMASSAFAQDGNIRSVTFYTVKPDRIGDFEAEVKAYNAVLAKGGSTHYASVWLSQTGPRDYARAIYYNKYADLDAGPDPKLKDQAADLARINVRIIDCTESWRRVIEEVNPDLSLPPSNDVPKMIRVLVTDVRPEKVGEYLDLVKNEILPAIKKAGVTEYNVASRRFGAPSTEFVSVLGLNNWADFDGEFGVEKGLGKEGYKALVAKVRTLIVRSQYDVYRFEPDLSYLPPPTAK
jgi:hypothetical protein